MRATAQDNFLRKQLQKEDWQQLVSKLLIFVIIKFLKNEKMNYTPKVGQKTFGVQFIFLYLTLPSVRNAVREF